MATLLEALGLPTLKTPPAGSTTAGSPPADAPLATKPIDLNLPKDSRLGLPPKKPPIDFSKPLDAKQVDVFADAIDKTTDAVLRDKLVKNLRDKVSKIPQPFLKPDEVKKKIDDAIKSLIESKSKELLLKLLEAAVGQKATTMPGPDAKPQYGPRVEEKDLGEKIFKIDLPLPGDKPKPVVRSFFEFKGLPRSAKPGSYVDFTLLTPHWFDPGKTPGSYVIVLDAAEFKKNAAGATRIHETHIDQTGSLKLSIQMPEAAGAAVLAVYVQSGYEHDPVETIDVKA